MAIHDHLMEDLENSHPCVQVFPRLCLTPHSLSNLGLSLTPLPSQALRTPALVAMPLAVMAPSSGIPSPNLSAFKMHRKPATTAKLSVACLAKNVHSYLGVNICPGLHSCGVKHHGPFYCVNAVILKQMFLILKVESWFFMSRFANSRESWRSRNVMLQQSPSLQPAGEVSR